MARHQLVTLLTDFGLQGPYVAAMKGVILQQCPNAQIVDISHDIPAHDVLAGAMVLSQAAPHFPAGTLHVVVIDPGVGTQRNILAAKCGQHLFLAPDNGVLTLVAQTLGMEALYACTNSAYLPQYASATFHGRDIFAPLAAHILKGVDISRLGPTPSRYASLEIPQPLFQAGKIIGQVIYVDHFGNLITNIPAEFAQQCFMDICRVRVGCNGKEVGGLQGSYGFVNEGSPLALENSMGLIEIAVNQGRACDMFGGGVGLPVVLIG